MRPQLVNFDGNLFLELFPGYLVYVETLEEFLKLTPEERSRAIRVALANAQPVSKTVH